MQLRLKSNVKRLDERGVAFTELAIVIPLVIFLCMFVFDFGMAIDRYLTLTRINYEAARYGARLSGLEAQTFTQASWDALPTKPSEQKKIRDRIQKLLEQNDLDIAHGFPPSDFRIETALQTGAAPNFIVEVSISNTYQPFFSRVPVLPLKVTARAPFLYPNSIN